MPDDGGVVVRSIDDDDDDSVVTEKILPAPSQSEEVSMGGCVWTKSCEERKHDIREIA